MASYHLASIGPFIRVGVVGCGRVGRTICFAIDAGRVHADLAAVCDTDADKVQNLIFQLKRPTRSMSLPGLVASVDLVIEATNRHVAPAVIMAAINGGKDVLVTNPAAILARDDFPRLAHERGLTIFAANALLAGGDALTAAAAMPGADLTLTITCPPRVLADAPFLRGRELKGAEEPQLVFQGEAGDALAAFPVLANMVAAAAIGARGAPLLVRVRTDAADDVTDVELTASFEKRELAARATVATSGDEPADPEAMGHLVIGFLRSLVSSVRVT